MIKKIFRFFAFDNATSYTLLLRVWTVLSGLITLVLIARCFTPEVQGYYCTFFSLLNLSVFFELGLGIVIINLVSHEWANLGFDSQGQVIGSPASLGRLFSLRRFVIKWYGVLSLLLVIGVGVTGFVFFGRNPHPGVSWQEPWLAVVSISGLQFFTLPLVSMLEGCNQIATVNKVRLICSVTCSLILWVTMVQGIGLWTVTVVAAAGPIANLVLILIIFPRFFRPVEGVSNSHSLDWRTEVWPLQWRIGLQGLMNYFCFSLYAPVMFHYRGAAEAGQIGMTLSLTAALGAVAFAWVQTSIPTFGSLIARRDFAALDRVVLSKFYVSWPVLVVASCFTWGGVYALSFTKPALASRLVDPLPLGMFLISTVLWHISYCQSAYLRAHKREVLLPVSVISSGLMGFLVWQLGSKYGALGAAVANLGVTSMLALPWQTMLLIRYRKLWHRPPHNAITNNEGVPTTGKP